MSLLSGRGLTKSYGGVTVLRDVDFATRGGEVNSTGRPKKEARQSDEAWQANG